MKRQLINLVLSAYVMGVGVVAFPKISAASPATGECGECFSDPYSCAAWVWDTCNREGGCESNSMCCVEGWYGHC